MNADFPVLAGDTLINWLVDAGGVARADGSTGRLPMVTLGLAEAAEVQGRVLGLVEGRGGAEWLVLIDGVELHHVRIADISRVSLSVEALRTMAEAPGKATVPGRLDLVRRAAAIAAAVQAELAAPFSIDLAFDHFPEDGASLGAIDLALDALAEALRRMTATPLGTGHLSVHIRSVQVTLAGTAPAGITRQDNRLIVRLPDTGGAVGFIDGETLFRELQAIFS